MNSHENVVSTARIASNEDVSCSVAKGWRTQAFVGLVSFARCVRCALHLDTGPHRVNAGGAGGLAKITATTAAARQERDPVYWYIIHYEGSIHDD